MSMYARMPLETQSPFARRMTDNRSQLSSVILRQHRLIETQRRRGAENYCYFLILLCVSAPLRLIISSFTPILNLELLQRISRQRRTGIGAANTKIKHRNHEKEQQHPSNHYSPRHIEPIVTWHWWFLFRDLDPWLVR